MKNNSIKKNLIIILLLFTLIPSLVFSFANFFSSTKAMNNLVNDNIFKGKEGIDKYLEDISNEAYIIANKYSTDSSIIEAFKSNDKNNLLNKVNPLFNDLKETNNISVFEFGDTNGNVYLRGHNPSKFGDNKLNTYL